MTATSDTLQNSTVTEINPTESDALTAKSRLATALVRANTLRIPSAIPSISICRQDEINAFNIWPKAVPRAAILEIGT